MGLPDEGEDRDDPETGAPPDVPRHRIRITRDFFLGVFEVTQQQYQQVMGTNPSWHSPAGGGRAEIVDQDSMQFPVEQVSWTDAAAFCRRLSALAAERDAGRRYRLPTEAEWEYACRAGSERPFKRPLMTLAEPTPEGDRHIFRPSRVDAAPQSNGPNNEPVPGEAESSGFNVRGNSTSGLPIRKVGSYAPNPLGLYDMRGNVFEWCADWYAWGYYRALPARRPPRSRLWCAPRRPRGRLAVHGARLQVHAVRHRALAHQPVYWLPRRLRRGWSLTQKGPVKGQDGGVGRAELEFPIAPHALR